MKKHVLNTTLCKELKKAGYFQDTNWYWIQAPMSEKFELKSQKFVREKYGAIPPKSYNLIFAAPLLTEILLKMPTVVVKRTAEKIYHVEWGNFFVTHTNVISAVAKMWMEIKGNATD